MVTSTKASWVAGALLSVSAACTQAGLIHAGQVDIDFDGSIFQVGSERVKIYYPDGPDRNQNREQSTVNAGMFHGDAREPAGGFGGFNPNVLYRGLQEVLLYCIDLYQHVGGGWRVTYDVHALAEQTGNVVEGDDDFHPGDRNFDRTLDFLGALNTYLASDYGQAEGDYNWLNPSNRWVSGAIQVGIWETLYESELKLDAASGSFYATHLENEGRDLLTDVFAAVNGDPNAFTYASLDHSKVLILTSDSRQDMIVGDPPASVPAPAPAAMLLFGLVLMARRHAGLS
jgi:hypothetical protein